MGTIIKPVNLGSPTVFLYMDFNFNPLTADVTSMMAFVTPPHVSIRESRPSTSDLTPSIAPFAKSLFITFVDNASNDAFSCAILPAILSRYFSFSSIAEPEALLTVVRTSSAVSKLDTRIASRSKDQERKGGNHMAKEYCLHLTEEQAEILSTACEFYSRIRIGQFGEITWNCLDIREAENYCERREAAEDLLFAARKFIYPDLHGVGHSYGIGKFDDADISFDIHQSVRYALGNSRKPFSLRPIPVCEVKQNTTIGE